MNKQMVANVLRILQSNEVPLQKVVLHKFLYFLNTQGFVTGFKFEPYTYGPFSFDLASTLGSMAFWDEIRQNSYTIEVNDLSGYSKPPQDAVALIENHLNEFKTVVEDFDFNNLECAGTVLYCAESLRSQGEKVTAENIEREFKAWKGTNYSSAAIQDMYGRLSPYINKQ
ncbi:hypothetical protein [Pseudodesulfovibrio methanolicus]|uniref:Antitoxin SocA-like Panacea domain-containing protein n=1 Tax=Pseudodesulfovibrio methanolicus TaxID=3126690 RepID=A0ABZ2IXG0_9BACT